MSDKPRAKTLMFAGTGSDVGKTVLVAGLCRLAHQRGYNVLPFKPQNMSNNAAVAQGVGEKAQAGEIGRGQWLQAFAAGVSPHVDMNPVLLKPQSDAQAQVIVQGQVYAQTSGRDYQRLKADLLQPVLQSFARLRQRADLVLVEGAGSVAEINLREYDIANMGFAQAIDVPVVLVGDIDRGGVIASLVGTYHILPPDDRQMIAGFLINKFRGDPSLFEPGLAAITHHTGWRSFGIVPWASSFGALPAEDSLALNTRRQGSGRRCRIVVPCLSHMANFDDFLPLEMEEEVELIWLRAGKAWPDDADLIILTGNKSTIAAMAELEKNGWADAIRTHAASDGAILGICGGLQMLGKSITDPDGQEGEQRQIAGLGLLDIETVMQPWKIVRTICAFDHRFGEKLHGYELHLGESSGADCANSPLVVDGKPASVANANGKIWGTYLHGLFANGAWRKKYLMTLGVHSQGREQTEMMNHALDQIANLLDGSLDIDALFALAR